MSSVLSFLLLPPSPDTSLPESGDLRPILHRFSSLLPSPLRKLLRHPFLASLRSRLLYLLATMLRSQGLLASNILYDLAISLLQLIVHLFFREVRSRGSHNIPTDGPTIFCAGPHHNQFLDPLILASVVRERSGRRVSFLIAEKSWKRAFVGTMSMLLKSSTYILLYMSMGIGDVRL
ncbi:hypothetical protein BT69DRAFT_1341190 [Atractiella rhizophila]|nr:hypothetical protein BT69DRAFT_1341190 [Atractiella rhizophila]